jgi:hypothetical protein
MKAPSQPRSADREIARLREIVANSSDTMIFRRRRGQPRRSAARSLCRSLALAEDRHEGPRGRPGNSRLGP